LGDGDPDGSVGPEEGWDGFGVLRELQIEIAK
jgi:hypothetical protein